MKLIIEDVDFSYGKKEVLKKVNLVAKGGDVISIIGKNGCGKTTLLKLIGDFLKPMKGRIDIEGRSESEGEALFAGTFEMPNFWNYMTGMENVQYYLKDKFCEEEIVELFKYWKMPEAKNVKVKDYSLGMRQKLMLIIAFASKAPILLFDEPISAIDQEGIVLFSEMLKKVRQEGRIVIFTTHIMYELEENSTRIYAIEDLTLIPYEHNGPDAKEMYVITFKTSEDAQKARDRLDAEEFLEIDGAKLTLCLNRRTISDVIRFICTYNIIAVTKVGEINSEYMTNRRKGY